MELEKHHIIFRSQGGLNIPLNLIELTPDEHRGANGPHQCRQTDLRMKRELQAKLDALFPEERYTSEEIAKKLKTSRNYIENQLKRLPQREGYGIYSREDLIRRLMGGKRY